MKQRGEFVQPLLTKQGEMTRFAESVVEQATLGWLEALVYAVLYGPDIAEGEPGAERSDPSYRDALLKGRLLTFA